MTYTIWRFRGERYDAYGREEIVNKVLAGGTMESLLDDVYVIQTFWKDMQW